MPAAFDAIGRVPATLEAVVAFACEVSVILVRGAGRRDALLRHPDNRHEGGILRTSAVPCGAAGRTQERARAIAQTIAEHSATSACWRWRCSTSAARGRCIVNEFAPRVHNSGHWTIDACAVSQFENHIRAVAGWPLGATERHSDARMQNLIGSEVDDWPGLAAEANACLHLYGKGEARPGRKMGHVTWLSPRSGGR